MRILAVEPSFYLPNGREPLYHQVKPLTVLMLSVVTIGLYSFWWHFKNWRCVQKNAAEAISPFFRAMFHPLYAISLYYIVHETSSNAGVGGKLFGVMGVFRLLSLFMAGNISQLTDHPFADYFDLFFTLVIWLSVDMVYVQFYVEKLNKKLAKAVE